jgi:hypothetical protein
MEASGKTSIGDCRDRNQGEGRDEVAQSDADIK